ncbi:DUF4998 domain-containing protein [Flammeovirgaceae bacterium SG7u.111]|nr:DUF4998 domain-containing protein [Flammeovirgaceae bacterium SG7u.132]WPO33735.1 DUF4998 domain-containing protein [Flammeovirgaceae bacterium SG7u.111]
MNIWYKIRMIIGCLFLALLSFSCSDWDTFKKFTEGGEIIYPGKMQSVIIYPGKERVQFNGILNPDPNIVSYKIRWNDNKDSITFDIDKPSGQLPVENIFSVDEGVKSFEVYTFDAKGNVSIPVNAVGVSYGDAYRRKLNNRLISDLTFEDSGTTINWSQMDLSTGPQYTVVEYEVGGEAKTLETPISESSTFLEGVTSTTTIKYKTVFKPESTSIDTFSTTFEDYLVKILPQMKNIRVPFAASATNGRWGILADWATNEAAKNHDGYGGWDEWNGNIFNVESGWGSPNITNGKIYQTLNLPAGSYTFKIDELLSTNIVDTDPVYLVAAEGTTLPDVENIDDALVYTQFLGNEIVFEVAEDKQVSIGILTSQQGDKFYNIVAFDFYLNE